MKQVEIYYSLQIDTADELMTTELMFNAVWQDLEAPQLVALLSCLVPCTEKNSQDEDAVRIPKILEQAVTTLQTFARSISAITTVCPVDCRRPRAAIKHRHDLLLSASSTNTVCRSAAWSTMSRHTSMASQQF